MATSRSLRIRNCVNYTNPDYSDCDIDQDSDDEEFSPGPAIQNQSSSDSSSDDENTPLINLRRSTKHDEGTDNSSDDDVPLSNLQNKTSTSKKAEKVMPTWSKKKFSPPNSEFKGKLESPPESGGVGSACSYFKRLITSEMLENIEKQTNLYSMQKDGIQVNTTSKEIELFIGIYIRMGHVKMPRVTAYWETSTRFPYIADHMTRNRFQKLASYLHFVDNNSVTEEEKQDKIWKLRPWVSELRKHFQTIPPEEHYAVDEIMVPFKGKSSLKQYIRGKPNPWGFKLWGRAGASGILYDFDVYQGKFGKNIENTIGIGGDVVLNLTESLESGLNYKIFTDNFSTSLTLVRELAKKSMFFIGTVRSNRLPNCALKTEKELKKQGRGATDYKVETSNNVVAVRWYDNKGVDIISSYVGVEPVGKVRRWDKTSRKYIQIDRPAIIERYNSFMGGVDLMDSLTSLYKQKIKSKRWYMYIFWHTVMVTVVNAWLWYKRHCSLLKLKTMKLSSFASDIAEVLIKVNAKVGRPPLSPICISPPNAKVSSTKLPVDVVRQDKNNHFLIWDPTRNRCKMGGCSSLTYVKCIKCGVYLCFN